MVAVVALFLVRGALLWILVSAAIDKLLHPTRLADALTPHLTRSRWLRISARQLVRTLAATELVVGFGLLIPAWWVVFALFAAVLLALFAVVLGWWYRTGQRGDCGCGGLVPLQDLTRVHVGGIALLSVSAGTVAGVGIFAQYPAEPVPAALAAKLLALVLPLPVLVMLAGIRWLLRIRGRLHALDAFYFGEVHE